MGSPSEPASISKHPCYDRESWALEQPDEPPPLRTDLATELVGEHIMEITFTLNGKSTTVDVVPEMPMLWVLRDELDLKGTKFGCGMGQCGACTVHIDGKARRTCRLAAEKAQGLDITTIEGLSPDGSHPVQLAWQEIDVPQCGYCQAGQIMSASALLAENNSPSDDDINEAMSGNVCRCATYTRIRKAIHRSAELAAGSNVGAATGSDAEGSLR